MRYCFVKVYCEFLIQVWYSWARRSSTVSDPSSIFLMQSAFAAASVQKRTVSLTRSLYYTGVRRTREAQANAAPQGVTK